MEKKKFTMIDEKFICDNCNNIVNPLGYTARNHCPKCLCSLHVDINPGDRLNNCLGLLMPIDIEKSKKDNYKIIYKCQKCSQIRKNIMAKDDDFDLIIKIMSQK